MSYQFSNLREILAGILGYISEADADMNSRGLTGRELNIDKWVMAYQQEFESPIQVQGPVRNQGIAAASIPILVQIEPVANDPMILDTKNKIFKRTNYWNVDIKVAPLDSSLGGHCFYMALLIPRNMATTPSVLVSWLYQIMIDPTSHMQVPVTACLGANVPNFQWGTLFMQLYETITQMMATEVHPLVLGGLVDDSFVQYCGHPVVFSDMRRFQGQAPWYETFGFRMVNEQEYLWALQVDHYYHAKESVDSNYNDYVSKLSNCSQGTMSAQEKSLFCVNDPTCSTLQVRADMGRYIAEAIRNNDESHGCAWVSDQAPLTCLTQFNRRYNPQTMHLRNEQGRMEDVVVRLKFYNP
jgi:hypothetical protein